MKFKHENHASMKVGEQTEYFYKQRHKQSQSENFMRNFTSYIHIFD